MAAASIADAVEVRRSKQADHSRTEGLAGDTTRPLRMNLIFGKDLSGFLFYDLDVVARRKRRSGS